MPLISSSVSSLRSESDPASAGALNFVAPSSHAGITLILTSARVEGAAPLASYFARAFFSLLPCSPSATALWHLRLREENVLPDNGVILQQQERGVSERERGGN
jgi:hypothetical protein